MPPPPPDTPSVGSREDPGPGTLAPDTQIGRFRVQNLLGQGGMGAVYQAWDPVLERKVALKAIRLGGDEAEEAMARFRREAMALAQLNHPNVCQVHDWVEARGSAYIAMEFIEGDTLAAASAGMDFRQKLRVLRSIARALEAAHAKGIVHRDLKPGNVMVDGRGRVKVLDFGLARLVDAAQAPDESFTGNVPCLPQLPEATGDEPTLAPPGRGLGSSAGGGSSPGTSWFDMTRIGVFMGTPSHASPEQIAGQRVGPSSDIFSLGLVAWELLGGEAPFPGQGRERLEAILRGKLNPLKARLPRRITGLLRAMLHRDPEKRPTSAEVAGILSRQLARIPAGWWLGGAAAVVIAMSGLGYLLFGRSVIADLARNHPPRLVVMPLQNETGDPTLDALVNVGMTELVATALRGSPSLTVVAPESVNRVVSSLHLSSGVRDPGREARLAKALGARLLFRGVVRKDAGRHTLVFSYQLVDTEGRLRLAGVSRIPRLTSFEPYTLVDPAVHALLRKVDPLRSAETQNAPVTPEVFATYANGKALFLKGDFKDSEAPLQEAAMKAPAFSSAVSTYAACLRRLGGDQAPLAANWALMSARATGDRWTEVQALGLKAYLAKDRGDLDEAQRLRQASLALAHAIGDSDGEIVATNHLGIIAAERGQDREAKAFYEQSLKLSQGTGDQVYQSLAQNNLANLALKHGDLAAATALYLNNLHLQQALGNRWGEALALNNLGVVALMSRDLPRAEGLLVKALSVRESVGDKAGQITCLRNLGILASMKGQLGAAAGDYARALDLAQGTGLRTIEAECQFYAADLDRIERHFGRAREGYQKVLTLLPPGVTPVVRANAQAGLAECLVRQPRPELSRAGQLLGGIGPEVADSPIVHRARAWFEFVSGHPKAALDELGQALADPHHEAPEIQPELAATQTLFLAGKRRG